MATTPTSSTTLRALPTVFIWSGCWYQSQLAIKDIKPSPAEFLLWESSYLLWNFRGILCIKAWRVQKWSQEQCEFHVLPIHTTLFNPYSVKNIRGKKSSPWQVWRWNLPTFLVLCWSAVRGVKGGGERHRGPGVWLPLQLSLLKVLLGAQLEAGQLKTKYQINSVLELELELELELPAWHQLKKMIEYRWSRDAKVFQQFPRYQKGNWMI